MYFIIFKNKSKFLRTILQNSRTIPGQMALFSNSRSFHGPRSNSRTFQGHIVPCHENRASDYNIFLFFDNLLSACHLFALILLLVTNCMRWILLSLCYWKMSNVWKTTNCSFQGITHNTDTISKSCQVAYKGKIWSPLASYKYIKMLSMILPFV